MIEAEPIAAVPILDRVEGLPTCASKRLPIAPLVDGLRRLTSLRNTATLLDQAIVSGMSFVLTICIGRIAGESELGLYALGLSLVMLLICAQESLITTPYTGFFHHLDERGRHLFAGSSLLQFGLLSVLAAALLATAAVISAAVDPSSKLWTILAILSVAIPMVLIRQLVRRLALARFQAIRVLVLDIAVALLQVVSLVALIVSEQVSAVTMHALAGLSAGAPAAAMLWIERRQIAFQVNRFGAGLHRSWQAGKWVLAGQGTGCLYSYALPWMIFALRGETATGTFAACSIVVDVANPFVLTVSNILTPLCALAFFQDGVSGVRRATRLCTSAIAVIMVPVTLALVIFGSAWLSLLYERSFSDETGTIAVLAIASLAHVLAFPLSTALWAVQRADLSFGPQLIGLVATVVTALVLISVSGVFGAAIAYFVGRVATLVASLWIYVRMDSHAAQVVLVQEVLA
jgi:O-antigen/teichoic acid export membrane protein